MPEEGESSASAKKSSSKDDRPIDNMKLAELLRESAKFVEEGKFDSILYQALQDFRVYYKQKYPKNIKRTKSDDKSHKKKGKKKTHAADAAEGDAKQESTRTVENAATVDGSQRSNPEEKTTAVVDDAATATTGSTNHIGETMPFDEPDAVAAAMKLGGEQQPNEVTPNVQSTQPHTNVPESAPKIPTASDHEPTPVETAVPLHEAQYQHPPPSETTHAVPAAAAASAHAASSTSHNTATKFHLGQAMFGKLGIPKVANNLKQAAFQATSKKNAQRAKEELGAYVNETSRIAESSARRKAPADVGAGHGRTQSEGGEYYEDWCDVHFCKGCACKSRNIHPSSSDDGPAAGHRPTTQSTPSDEYQHLRTQSSDGGGGGGGGTAAAATGAAQTEPKVETNRPSFQRPTNKDSPLVVNGWIEQYRRSKMRHVWKDVLASLVKGRNPGEETTLWVQREIFNPMTGRKELEALERIPMKVVEDVELKEYTTDHQFTIRIFNNAEEFVFRCNDAPADAMMWVQTLRKYQMIARGVAVEEEEVVEEKKETSPPPRPATQQPQQPAYPQQQPRQPQAYPQQPANATAPTETAALSVKELRAICHGAGINTAGMERSQLIHAADQVRQRGTYFDQRGAAQTSAPHVSPQYPHAPPPGPPPSAAPPVPPPQPPTQSHARAASDSNVEQPPAQQEGRTVSDGDIPQQQVPPSQPAPPPSSAPPQAPSPVPEDTAPTEKPKLSIKELRAVCHGAGINTMGMERRELEAAAEEVQNRGTYFEPPPGMHAPTEEEVRAKEEEFRKHQEIRAQQEETRRRQQAEEARRRAAAEEEARRKAAEEHHRRQQEAQAQYQQQQAAWQRQKQEEEQRQRYAQQQAAEQQRQREEAYRKQQWAQQQQQQHHNQGQGQRPGWHQQQQQQHPQHNQQHQQQQQQQQQQPHHTAAGDKYAAMANQTEQDGQAVITRIKHDILIHWALQPPQLQMLRSVDVLITTIHNVFPPALGVPAHDYFKDYKPISKSDIAGPSGLPDDTKLKKSVRKLRFFLHPDRLPRDLNEEQKFMTKMLWDVTSDAWEEYQKSKEDLDWVTS